MKWSTTTNCAIGLLLAAAGCCLSATRDGDGGSTSSGAVLCGGDGTCPVGLACVSGQCVSLSGSGGTSGLTSTGGEGSSSGSGGPISSGSGSVISSASSTSGGNTTDGGATGGNSTTGGTMTGGGATAGSSTGSTCPQPFIICGVVCTDTRYDPTNCGGCDAPCLAGQSCNDGTCAGVPDAGDAGFECSPGIYFCIGEDQWQCNLDGTDGTFVQNCPTFNGGICQTSTQDSDCPQSMGACCCDNGVCYTP